MLPNPGNVNRELHGFSAYSYLAILTGLGHHPKEGPPKLDYLGDQLAEQVFNDAKTRAVRLAKTLPSHHEYLEQTYGETSPT